MDQLDELERLLQAATPGRLRQGEMSPQGIPYVGGTLLIAAAVNAAPALLPLARAALALYQAADAVRSHPSPTIALERWRLAEGKLYAACEAYLSTTTRKEGEDEPQVNL